MTIGEWWWLAVSSRKPFQQNSELHPHWVSNYYGIVGKVNLFLKNRRNLNN